MEKQPTRRKSIIFPKNIIFSIHFSPTDRPYFFQISPVKLLINLVSPYTFVSYSQLHFRRKARVATESAQNEPQGCYEVANVF